MGRKALELRGKRFGRLTVLKRTGRDKGGNVFWLCQCDCGNIKEIRGMSLKPGGTQSCGCFQKEEMSKTKIKHGHKANGIATKTYKAWQAIHQRCNNPNSPAYEDYGGRGITVCEQWNTFENFLEDMGEGPEGLTIDRKDNDGNYEPGNCRWATPKEQNRNTNRTKLTPLKVQVIKKLLKESQLRQLDIADIFSIKQFTISSIKIGRIWSDINY